MKNAFPSRRRTGKQRLAILALALGGLLGSGNAVSSGIPVVDVGHIAVQVQEFGTEALRWGEQGQQWLKEAQQFTQQYNSFLSNIQNMQSAFGLPQGTPLEPVEENYMVQERCGDAYGGGVAGVLGRMTGFTLSDNPQQKRWEYCASLQRMRNKQYNEMVAYLQETMPQMHQELNQAGNSFTGGQKTEGEMNAYSAKLQKVKGDIAKSNEEFDARMKAYDTFAKAIEINQGTLSRAAMRGHSGLLTKVAATAVMYQALCGGGQCDD
ncbi:hypothetical protein [Marilutibacter chinensis]|uniref:Type IV secretion system protein VirB5 n=1 Tax=Marilutibacter chinensis TaxID=2912247 RepID=A0ABS9HRW5_9GAMM|nr:hypothetical protein [Lysobacter chinensis]MCF7221665.1 hypothetical protein [Lysobacter chinensis]